MKNIILIGFKHTGKSAVGASLAKELGRGYVDLDTAVEQRHKENQGEELNSRQIVKLHGIDYFRIFEKEVLQEILNNNNDLILSVGGGTVIDAENRDLISKHTVVHVTAPRSIVYERIMVNGKPAFFPDDTNSFTTFIDIWEERRPHYEALADFTVNNSNSLYSAVEKIIKDLRLKNKD